MDTEGFDLKTIHDIQERLEGLHKMALAAIELDKKGVILKGINSNE